MGKVIDHNQLTVNGAFEAPTPEEWGARRRQRRRRPRATDPGRHAAPRPQDVWPQLGEDPAMGYYAERTLSGPLEWNATLIEGEAVQAVPALKEKHTGNLIISGWGELAHSLAAQGVVDEFWFWVNPQSGRPGRGSSTVSALSACSWSRPRPIDLESSGCATGRPMPEGKGS